VAKGGTPKPGRVVLDFRPRGGKPCAMVLNDPGKESSNMPFGDGPAVPGSDPGLTIVAAFQADSSRLPTRVCTLSNRDGTSVSLKVDAARNLIAEVRHKGGSPTLTSKDVNGAIACLAFVTWNERTGAVELRVRDSDGKAFTSSGGKSKAPDQPLTSLEVGRVKDSKGGMAGSGEQFSGYLGELFVYAVALKPDQIQLIDGRVRDHYFQPPAPAPLKSRLKTKLAWIEPRAAWKLSASAKREECAKTVDDDTVTRWTSSATMRGGEWFQIELPVEADIAGLALDSQSNTQDYARKYKIEVSKDGSAWGTPVAEGENRSPLMEVVFRKPERARFVRITQTGTAGVNWGISEVTLFKR
jgi:hypothetical protein